MAQRLSTNQHACLKDKLAYGQVGANGCGYESLCIACLEDMSHHLVALCTNYAYSGENT